MSAWYVMSAMGFYPIDPCGGEYELGVPLFPEAKLHLANGNVFTVVCHFDDNKEEKSQKAIKPRLNGKRIKGTTISHNDIMEGGALEFK